MSSWFTVNSLPLPTDKLKMNNATLRLALLLSAALFTIPSQAQSELSFSPAGQGVRAAGDQSLLNLRTLDVETRELSLESTSALLHSTEGAAWQVYAVQAPATCSAAEQHKLKKKKKYLEAKNCRKAREICASATKFAKKNDAHVACSSLYTLTTILLKNSRDGRK